MSEKVFDQLNIPAQQPIGFDVPSAFERLPELAYNLWWSWSPEARRLFSFLGPERWTRYGNPIEILIEMDPPNWYPLKNNEEFMALYSQVVQDFDEYMSRDEDVPEDDYSDPVAYFSTEYGIHDCLPIYSGGLGVLSGDHMKSSSDLCLPLVGVGLLYRHGYFEQCIDADGTQHHVLPRIDFSRLPIQQVLNKNGRPMVINCPLRSEEVKLRVWKIQVGHVPIILLDSDFPGNPPELQPITGQLYVRERESRLCQEIVLGVGGAIALEKLGIEPSAWHLNEGHSVFLTSHRLQDQLNNGNTLEQAVDSLADNTLFTTHTPVEAGHERYDCELVEEYFQKFCDENNVSTDKFLDLGRAQSDSEDQFNLTAFAIRSARRTNGVSKLHEEVTRDMWGDLLEDDELFSITNGIHAPTWLGYDIRDLLVTPEAPWGEEGVEKMISTLEESSDKKLWAAHKYQKERLIRTSRFILREQRSRHGQSPDELYKIQDIIDKDALLIGFARRFATYKRANLIFRDFERTKKMLTDSEKPLQIIFAGKAHPADKQGQGLIREIYDYMSDPEVNGSIIFLENYDMSLASRLVQGVDVWLNSPRRPNEASGTSGMKAALNGILNLSISDGWWAEGYNGDNGWVFGAEKDYDDLEHQDHEDAVDLYETLENEVIPTFYDRNEKGIPTNWLRMMRSSIKSVLPAFCSSRMVGQYDEQAYRELM
ncbi:MAG: alpha-glucan family phosphorylase [bacterium]